jgi:hypothetical protein
MSSFKSLSFQRPASLVSGLVFAAGLMAADAHALVLDWSGQFWAENLSFSNYSLGGDSNQVPDAARMTAGVPRGAYIPGGGSTTATWQSLFLRLRPKAIVNDNVTIKSELWAGNPTFGMFGDAAGQSSDLRFFNSTGSRGSVFSAQRLWAEVMTDVGTLQVGRMPLQWGLGIVWNSGDSLFSRYVSTGDAVRLVSKFGAFTFIPSFIKYSQGNSVGGVCEFTAGNCGTLLGTGSVVDYSLILKYENPDDDVEGGLNFIRRLVGASQDASSGTTGLVSTTAAGGSFNQFSLYGKKKFRKFSAGVEVPLTSGEVAGLTYSTFAVASEAGWAPTENLNFSLKAGIAPGQPNDNNSRDSARAFFFHPNYKLGLVMFGTQLAALSRLATLNDPSATAANLASPFDNPIVNANYLNFGGSYSTDRWTFGGSLTFASARETAKSSSTHFYNTVSRQFEAFGAAPFDQASFLGWEMDYGIGLKWDDHFTFQLDFGWFFPGDYFKFSNTATENAISSVFASAIRVGVNF